MYVVKYLKDNVTECKSGWMSEIIFVQIIFMQIFYDYNKYYYFFIRIFSNYLFIHFTSDIGWNETPCKL